MRINLLAVGEPAPWFTCRSQVNDSFQFDTAAGRYIVLSFLGSVGDPASKRIIAAIQSVCHRFDDINLSFFGVSTDELDLYEEQITDTLRSIHYLWDFDLAVSKLYGAVRPNGNYRKVTYLLDPALRVLAVFPFTSATKDNLSSLKKVVEKIPLLGPRRIAARQAPVLVLPRIFEPKLCKALIDYYNRTGGKETGFMKDLDGKTVGVIDHAYKRRRDCRIKDESLRRACMVRVHDRLMPEVRKVFQFPATRLERYLIACYEARDKGFFRPHRDNTTKATVHRRFAVSLFLNSGDYEGGYLRFPEYGPALYSAPTGGAVIFSCSLLHEATKVTKGRRYMFLPFIHDEVGQKIREDAQQFLAGTTIKNTSETVQDTATDDDTY